MLKNKNEQTHCYDLKVGFDEDTKLVSLIDMNGSSDYLEIYVRQNTSNDAIYNASQNQGGEFSGFLVG